MFPDQGHLLAEMRVVTEDDGLQGRPTEALLAPSPVDPALPGTELSPFEEGIDLFNPLTEFAFVFKSRVGWSPFLIP